MPISLKDINNRLLTPASLYIAINLCVSAVGFLKSMLFMRWLGIDELGIVSLAQTIMSFISIFQIGLINGGYRIFSLDRENEQKDINNLIFSYIFCLTFVFLLFWCVALISKVSLFMSSQILLITIACGLLMLTNNWLTNTLIGKRKLKELNYVNAISAGASIVILPLVAIWGLFGAILVLLLQPLIFVSVILLRNRELRPTDFLINLNIVRYILGFGFIPFIAGIFETLNLQIERWSIANILGTAALGDFYLVALFYHLFVLVPNSINSIFFPQAVRAFDKKDFFVFRQIIEKQALVMAGYDVIIIIATLFLLQPMVDFLFPKHSGNVVYVYFYLPGLIILSFTNVISMIQNSIVRLRPMLISGIVSVLLTGSLVFSFNQLGYFSLKGMTIIKVCVMCVAFVYMFIDIVYAKKTKKIYTGGGDD